MSSSAVISRASDPGGEPHPALLLALPYMRLLDLFSCQRACRSFRDAVATNPLLWRSVVVEPPLSSKLSNDALWELTSKAGGRLQCLALDDCRRITDAGLRRVVDANPTLSKISLLQCMHLSASGVVSLVQSLEKGVLKHIRLYGIPGLSKDHLNILKALVGDNTQQKAFKPFYYSRWCSQESIDDDDCAIDVDICPRCGEVRLIFDCTLQTCRRTDSQTGCRACLSCIDRCADCGGCVDHEEELETLCPHSLCLECWLVHPKCCECNRPHCRHHEHLSEAGAGPAGFVCEKCRLLDAMKQDTGSEGDD